MTAPTRRVGRRSSSRQRPFAISLFVLSTLLQLTLVSVGYGYIAADNEATGLLLLTLWCVIGTLYAAGIAFVLWATSRWRDPDQVPTLLELSWAPRMISIVSTLLTSLVGGYAAIQHILLDPADEFSIFVAFVGVWAMLLSWFLLHWGFTQLYMHGYYRTDRPTLRFPSAPLPGVLEFAYFSYTVAVSFAASDVEVHDPRMRFRVLMQSVLSFFFNGLIIVIALTSIANAGPGS